MPPISRITMARHWLTTVFKSAAAKFGAVPARVPSWTLVAVVLLAVTLTSIGNAYREYNNTIEQGFRSLEIHARQRVTSITGALESVNLLLGSLIDDFSKSAGASTEVQNHLLSNALRLLPQLRSINVNDASGHISASSNEKLVGVDISTREYFVHHRDAPLDDRFHISRPFKTVTGVYATTLSRVMLDKHNQFAGVIVATFESSYFNNILELKVPSPGLGATLIHRDGDIISSIPKVSLVGQSIVGGPAYTDHIAKQSLVSRHLNVVKLSKIERMTVFHDLPNAPLAIIMGHDYDEVIAEWRKSLIIHIGGFGALTAITLMAFAIALRQKQELAEREKFIHTVTDAMPGMVGYWDTELRCRFANRTYLDWFGKPPHAIVGTSMLDLLGETLFALTEPHARAALTGKVQRFERTLAKADGSTGYAWAHYIPDVRNDGAVTGFFVLIHDVTTIKQAEIALEQKNAALEHEIERRATLEQRLLDNNLFVSSILDSMTENVAVIDGQGVITAVNAAWRQFAAENGGANMPQLEVGANYLSVCAAAIQAVDGAEAADVIAGINAVLNGTAEEFTLEYPCHSPTEQRWFVLHGLPLRGPSKGAVLIHQNVTGRHQAEAALRASEEHFRMLAENMGDVVWKADSQMRFTYINDADFRLRGFVREEVIGRPIADTLTPEGQTMLAALSELRQSLEASGGPGTSIRFDIPQRRKDGGEVWVDVLTSPFYGIDGQIKGYQGIVRDISERRRHEHELAESQHALELRLDEVQAQKIDLQEMATRDQLTGVYNRRYLDESLPRELVRAKRERYPVSIIMIDLDHFKNVNDTYSHAAGDEVLRTIGRMLIKGARESDLVCRYGGEEFVIVMPRMSLAMAFQRMELWRTEISESPVHYKEHLIRVTLSAGISAFPAHADSVENLLSIADQMLYRAKHEGRNRVVVFEGG